MPRHRAPADAVGRRLPPRLALDEMKQRFGSIETYLEEGLGIDSDGQPVPRDMLVAA